MNKKKLMVFSIIGIFALVIVSAIGHYALLNFDVIVTQPISVDGLGLLSIHCTTGHTCIGDVVTISNGDSINREISVLVSDLNDSLTTGIVGEVILSQKDESNNWNETGENATVYYTIVGDKFNYKVDSSLENYVLIYYPDLNSAKDWNIDNAVEIGDAKNEWTTRDLSDLPNVTDYNIAPDTNYCDFNNGFDDYLHCSNAKLWLMEKTDWEIKAWDSVNTLFETDLITYTDNIDGTTIVLVPAGGSVNVYPQVTVDNYAQSGDYPIEITIA